MKRRFKNGEIFNAAESLTALLKSKLPVTTSYQLARIIKKFNERLKDIEEVRMELLRKYGEPSKDDPNRIEIKPESPNFPQFIEELEELFAIEDEEMVFQKIRLPNDFEIEASTLVPLVDLGLIEEPC